MVLFYPDKTKIPNCWRDNAFFAAMGVGLVEETVAAFPDTFSIEYNTLPGHWIFRVGLRDQPSPIRPAPVIQQQQPDDGPNLPAEDLARMRHKIASRGMWRGKPVNAQTAQHRPRHPLIVLPE
jgi:hypothetical protein